MIATQERLDALTESVERHDREAVRAFLKDVHPADTAPLVVQLDKRNRRRLFRLLPITSAVSLLEAMSVQDQAELVEPIGVQRMAMLLGHLPAYRAADLLSELPEAQSEQVLNLLGPREHQAAKRLLAYPKESAGRIMSTEYFAFPVTATIGQIRKHLQSLGPKLDRPKAVYVYIVDHQHLVGVVPPGVLFFKPATLSAVKVMTTDLVTVPATMDREEAAALFRRYSLGALPVVDDSHRLLGVITVDDVIETIQEEAVEDLLKLGGIVSGEQSHSMPVIQLVRKRLSWLSLNVVLNLIAASVIAFFQDTIQAAVIIAVFLPIISDMSGCSGMQAVAVSIRDLALGRIRPRDFNWVLWKECLVGLINGCVLGLEIGVIAWLWKGLPMLGVVVAAALWINTIVSVGIGGSIPLLLKRFKLDPAIASGPILTTITDICGFFVLLSLATFFLPYLVTR